MSGFYYLEYHDAPSNSHKFYAGNPSTGEVLYGRVGATGTLKHYGSKSKVVDMKYEKQKKGYKSASPVPTYIEDRLGAVTKQGIRKKVKPKIIKVKPVKVTPVKITANRGLLNWFSSLSRTE